ncbi:MAG: UDP-N-acetylglucosamine 2-epimerase (non-hydrolyzing) [Microthrixaceae bacterium]|nr:UDP-N-acetylglucosamine 2-epimerase (non-hydrolyzing) [Microthrixaceae bacterium]
MRVLSVFGTRPEAIKMAPVVKALEQSVGVTSAVCVTGQHRSMLDQVLALFEIAPDVDLDLMSVGQSPTEVLSRVLEGIRPVLSSFDPDVVLVQGDTTTAMAAALGAAYHGAVVGHVEAGLRTWNKRQPFPEELNRLVVASCADHHFAPTAGAAANLLREGHDAMSVSITGNTVIDALLHVADLTLDLDSSDPLARLDERDIVLVTAHRRENFGAPFEEAFGALAELAETFDDEIQLVYPVHPNPSVSAMAHRFFDAVDNVTLTEPLDYRRLVHVMQRSRLVITDSGGIQEEAPSLGKPVLVLREVTERPEAVEAGTVKLVGCNRHVILTEATRLLTDDLEYADMAHRVNPYGDGKASDRIVAALTGSPIADFQAA